MSREWDKEIAEQFFGLVVEKQPSGNYVFRDPVGSTWKALPHYSTNLKDAASLLNKVTRLGASVKQDGQNHIVYDDHTGEELFTCKESEPEEAAHLVAEFVIRRIHARKAAEAKTALKSKRG